MATAAACALVLFVLAPAAAFGDEPIGFLEVTQEAGIFSIEAEELPLVRVLREVGRQADFKVDDPAGAGAEAEVEYFEVEDAPLDQALAGLLGNTNHLVVYRTGAREEMLVGAIEKIILLRPVDPDAPRVVRKGVSPLAGPVAPPVRPAPEAATPEAGDGGVVIDEAEDDADPIDRALAIELALEAALEAPDGAGLPPEVGDALRDIDPALVADVEDALRGPGGNEDR